VAEHEKKLKHGRHRHHHMRDKDGVSVASSITEDTHDQFIPMQSYDLLYFLREKQTDETDEQQHQQQQLNPYNNHRPRTCPTGHPGGTRSSANSSVAGCSTTSDDDTMRAFREYCLSDLSVDSRGLVKVPFQRHRHLRKLDRFKFKNDVMFISKRQKEKKLVIREMHLEEIAAKTAKENSVPF
jgi:hypothetical protein